MRTMTTAELDPTADHRVERLVDDHMVEPTVLPKGRKGLWGALAVAVAPRITERALPRTDAGAVGATRSMFDYDPALAVRLEGG